ncbi:hypothetical protein VTH06DRAFT_7833 [Thermothelomyces fergusii]
MQFWVPAGSAPDQLPHPVYSCPTTEISPASRALSDWFCKTQQVSQVPRPDVVIMDRRLVPEKAKTPNVV